MKASLASSDFFNEGMKTITRPIPHLYFQILFAVFFSSACFAGDGEREDIVVEKQFFTKIGGGGKYEMNISFPRISYPRAEVNHEVNLDIQRIMTLAISDFTKKMTEKVESEGYSSLTLDYKVYFHHADILSLRFIKHTVVAGNQKPSDFFLTYNYDLKNGRVIQLTDIFSDNEDFKSKVLNLAVNQLGRCKIKGDYALKNFCIELEGLILSIDDLTKNGKNCLDEIKISWEDLGEILRQDGIASLFFQR